MYGPNEVVRDIGLVEKLVVISNCTIVGKRTKVNSQITHPDEREREREREVTFWSWSPSSKGQPVPQSSWPFHLTDWRRREQVKDTAETKP